MKPQHEFIIEYFGKDCLIRYDKSHAWKKDPKTIGEYVKIGIHRVLARKAQDDELILDIGDKILRDKGWKKKAITPSQAKEIYPLMRGEAEKTVEFLKLHNIPYWLCFTGRSYHIHVFYKKGGGNKKFKNNIINWMRKETNVDLCEDVNNRNSLMIKEIGSVDHSKTQYVAQKTWFKKVPKEFPLKDIQSEFIKYPDKKMYWNIPQDLINDFKKYKPILRHNKYWKSDTQVNRDVSKFLFIKKVRKARRLIND